VEAFTVCMFAPTASGGHARYAWELTTALSRHPRGNLRYELVSAADLDGAFRSADYRVHPILPPIRQRSSFRTRAGWALNRLAYYPVRERAFLRWLRSRGDVAVVHLQEWKPWLAPSVIRRIRRMGKKVCYTVHNVLPHRYPRGAPKWLTDHWIRRSCRACDGLFVHTDRLADELAKFLRGRHPPITVVPHGVWTTDQSPPPPPLERRLESKRLLFFGAIRRNKGLDLLLRAMPHLPGYRLTIAGEPCEPDYFKNEVLPRVRALRGDGVQIELLDRFVSEQEVSALFSEHSAIVLPYTGQFVAQSGVVFMALAHSLPVVASRAGGLSDLLGEFPIGTTFDGESPEALAAAVVELHLAAGRDELGRQIEAARRRFTWHAAAGATIGGYLAALEAVNEVNDCVLGTTPAH
jgi:glycosyltransferase involved in cell wall biosynthesis